MLKPTLSLALIIAALALLLGCPPHETHGNGGSSNGGHGSAAQALDGGPGGGP